MEVRPTNKKISGSVFKMTNVSKDLKTVEFVRKGKKYTNSTLPLKEIMDDGGISYIATAVKVGIL